MGPSSTTRRFPAAAWASHGSVERSTAQPNRPDLFSEHFHVPAAPPDGCGRRRFGVEHACRRIHTMLASLIMPMSNMAAKGHVPTPFEIRDRLGFPVGIPFESTSAMAVNSFSCLGIGRRSTANPHWPTVPPRLAGPDQQMPCPRLYDTPGCVVPYPGENRNTDPHQPSSIGIPIQKEEQ